MSDSDRIMKIKTIMKKTSVTYEKAERLLHKSQDEPEKAIEKYNKRKKSVFMHVLRWLYGIIKYKLVVRGKTQAYLRLPLWLIVVLAYLFFQDRLFYVLSEYIPAAILVVTMVIILFGLEVLITNRDNVNFVNITKKHEDDAIVTDKEYAVEEDSDGTLRLVVRD